MNSFTNSIRSHPGHLASLLTSWPSWVRRVWSGPELCSANAFAPLRSWQRNRSFWHALLPVFYSSNRVVLTLRLLFTLRGRTQLSSFYQSLRWTASQVQVEMCLAMGVMTVLVVGSSHSQLSLCMRYIFRWSLTREMWRLNRWADFSGKTCRRWKLLVNRLSDLKKKAGSHFVFWNLFT